jgi:hypothetical protein
MGDTLYAIRLGVKRPSFYCLIQFYKRWNRLMRRLCLDRSFKTVVVSIHFTPKKGSTKNHRTPNHPWVIFFFVRKCPCFISKILFQSIWKDLSHHSSFKKQIKNQEIAHSSNFVSPQYFFSQLLVFAQRPRFRSCSLLLHLILNFVLKSVHKTDSRWLSQMFSAASLSTIVGFSFWLIQCFAQVHAVIILPNQLTVTYCFLHFPPPPLLPL